ncbi:hypothetical protein J6590_035409 [Homalodisca vitripennis]|nr:hypothetical protein J6590_035409 [Homalodisca vitripennis]
MRWSRLTRRTRELYTGSGGGLHSRLCAGALVGQGGGRSPRNGRKIYWTQVRYKRSSRRTQRLPLSPRFYGRNRSNVWKRPPNKCLLLRNFINAISQRQNAERVRKVGVAAAAREGLVWGNNRDSRSSLVLQLFLPWSVRARTGSLTRSFLRLPDRVSPAVRCCQVEPANSLTPRFDVVACLRPDIMHGEHCVTFVTNKGGLLQESFIDKKAGKEIHKVTQEGCPPSGALSLALIALQGKHFSRVSDLPFENAYKIKNRRERKGFKHTQKLFGVQSKRCHYTKCKSRVRESQLHITPAHAKYSTTSGSDFLLFQTDSDRYDRRARRTRALVELGAINRTNWSITCQIRPVTSGYRTCKPSCTLPQLLRRDPPLTRRDAQITPIKRPNRLTKRSVPPNCGTYYKAFCNAALSKKNGAKLRFIYSQTKNHKIMSESQNSLKNGAKQTDGRITESTGVIFIKNHMRAMVTIIEIPMGFSGLFCRSFWIKSSQARNEWLGRCEQQSDIGAQEDSVLSSVIPDQFLELLCRRCGRTNRPDATIMFHGPNYSLRPLSPSCISSLPYSLPSITPVCTLRPLPLRFH